MRAELKTFQLIYSKTVVKVAPFFNGSLGRKNTENINTFPKS